MQNGSFNIHPESNKVVENYRGTQCDKRKIDKILPDNSRSNPQSLAYCSANTEYMPFDKMFEIFHNANLQYFMGIRVYKMPFS